MSYANHGCKIVLLGRGLEKAFMHHGCLDGRLRIILVALRKRGKGFVLGRVFINSLFSSLISQSENGKRSSRFCELHFGYSNT